MNATESRAYLLADDTIDQADLDELIEWLRGNPWLTMGPLTREFERAGRAGSAWTTRLRELGLLGEPAHVLRAALLGPAPEPQGRGAGGELGDHGGARDAARLRADDVRGRPARRSRLDVAHLDAPLRRARSRRGDPGPRARRARGHGRAACGSRPGTSSSSWRTAARPPARATTAARWARSASCRASRSTSATTSPRSRAAWCARATRSSPTSSSRSGATAGRRTSRPDKEALQARKHDVIEFNRRFTFYYPGFNVRSTDLNARLGLAQLRKADAVVARRVENHRAYQARFANAAGFACQTNPRATISSISFVALAALARAPGARSAARWTPTGSRRGRSAAATCPRQPFWVERYGGAAVPGRRRRSTSGASCCRTIRG